MSARGDLYGVDPDCPTCDGDGYVDIVDVDGGVIGPAACPACFGDIAAKSWDTQPAAEQEGNSDDTYPLIERAMRIAEAVRADDSDPPGFALWKPWALELADGVDALARRLEAAEEWQLNIAVKHTQMAERLDAAETDLAVLRAQVSSILDWCIGYFSDPGFTPTKPYFDRGTERLREARAALGATDEGGDR